MKNTQKITWKSCTNDNYWNSENDIVAYILNGDLFINTKSSCPYGWNVLCDMKAKITTIENPFQN
jgi:hypothetical protein